MNLNWLLSYVVRSKTIHSQAASQSRFTVSSADGSIEPCRLFFVLPDAMLRVLDE